MFKHSRLLLSTTACLLAACTTVAAQQRTPQLSPGDLIKAVIHNELSNPEGSQVHWKYIVDKDADGKQETREVVETKSGALDRLIAVGGTRLNDVQQGQETKRILQLANNPEQQRKLEESRRKDTEQCNAFLKMIPDAFVFAYANEQPINNSYKLTFRPNPAYKPPSWEGKILHQMSGEMWVDAEQMRLVSVSGQLLNDVKFAGGLLGHLEKGGTFLVKRAQVEPRQWETVFMQVNMNGKALLFKTIAVQQKELHRNFERVPEGLSMADAAAVLTRQSLIAAKK